MRLDMTRRPTSKDEQDIPEYKREQLGGGVRGKHYKQFVQGSNEVVLPSDSKRQVVEFNSRVEDGRIAKLKGPASQ